MHLPSRLLHRPTWLLVLWSLGLALSACALPAPTTGTLLSSSPTPVAEALFQVRGRHTDLVSVHMVFPSDAHGVPLRPLEDSGWPALLLVQGGLAPVLTRSERAGADALQRIVQRLSRRLFARPEG